MPDEPIQQLELSLARLEGKIDTLVIGFNGLRASVTDIDSRVRDLETQMAKVEQQLDTMRQEKSRVPNWATAAGAIVAIVAAVIAVGGIIP